MQKVNCLDVITICNEVGLWVEIHNEQELILYIATHNITKEQYLQKQKIQIYNPDHFLLRLYDGWTKIKNDYDDRYKNSPPGLPPMPSLK